MSYRTYAMGDEKFKMAKAEDKTRQHCYQCEATELEGEELGYVHETGACFSCKKNKRLVRIGYRKSTARKRERAFMAECETDANTQVALKKSKGEK